jgi:hypothetical protein
MVRSVRCSECADDVPRKQCVTLQALLRSRAKRSDARIRRTSSIRMLSTFLSPSLRPPVPVPTSLSPDSSGHGRHRRAAYLFMACRSRSVAVGLAPPVVVILVGSQ